MEAIARIVSPKADARSLNWALLRYQHTNAIRAALQSRYAPATANKMMSALRGVLREAWRLNLMSAEDFQRAADLRTIKAEVLPRGRALSAGELRSLFRVCAADTSPAGRRDAALVGALYGVGLRRGEVAALKTSDFDREQEAFTVRSGKGRKDRITYASRGTIEAVEAWLEVRGESKGPLFVPINKGGSLAIRHLTGQAILGILQKRAEEAGVAAFSPHDLRRTFVSDLLDAGADITTVQKLAGHASVVTTSRYDRRPEEAKRRAAALLHVPFKESR
ncbi:MAG: tyrosine-type recombinase/integrase [Actinomycetota bacterium]